MTLAAIADKTVRQEHAVLVGREGAIHHLQTASGLIQAKRAAGCLLTPSLGDTVQVAIPEQGWAYILCVLERDDNASADLYFPTGATLRSGAGLHIQAKDAVRMGSAVAVEMAAPRIQAGAAEVEINGDKITLAGRLLSANASAIRFMAEKLDQLADRLFLRAKTSHRRIEGHEHANVGAMTVNAKKTLSLHAEFSQVTAKEDVRVNAERVHIG
ncbi:MAG: hypothetical protein PWQ57_26 [Desulfovibrionales bacterium]|jgi:hypothetical protein|nr:hypothetical protein [Desulfovibrionales bacterium]